MRYRSLALALALAPSVALADSDEAPPPTVDGSLMSVIQLPLLAHALRGSKVSDEDVGAAIESARKHGMDAEATADMLRRSAAAAREHGHIDNFGGFIQQTLESGARGPELGLAIRREHESRGSRHQLPPGMARPRPADGWVDAQGRPVKPEGDGERGDAEGEGHGRPEGDEHGRPEGAGHPEGDHGRPEGADHAQGGPHGKEEGR